MTFYINGGYYGSYYSVLIAEGYNADTKTATSIQWGALATTTINTQVATPATVFLSSCYDTNIQSQSTYRGVFYYNGSKSTTSPKVDKFELTDSWGTLIQQPNNVLKTNLERILVSCSSNDISKGTIALFGGSQRNYTTFGSSFFARRTWNDETQSDSVYGLAEITTIGENEFIRLENVEEVCRWYSTARNKTYIIFNATTLESSVDVRAVFGTYREIIVEANDPTLGEVSGGGSYADGDVITITATPYEGSKFDGWDDGDKSSTREIVVSGDKTFTALFSKIPPPRMTITATIDGDKFRFVSWNDGLTENPRTINTNESYNLVAKFESVSGTEPKTEVDINFNFA